MAKDCELVVIGAGPGGYVAAIRAAQKGVKVTVVEKAELGGCCLNWGCIPSKALIHAADVVDEARHASDMGITFGETKVDLAKLVAWKDGIVDRLTGGIGQLFKARKIEHIQGTAVFTGRDTLEVEGDDGKQTLKFKDCIVATGGMPIQIPGFDFSDDAVWDAAEALSPDTMPDDLVIIGGGIIGCELGTVYAKLGAKVTIVEALDSILNTVDPDLVKVLTREFKKRKVKVHAGAQASGMKKAKGGRVTVQAEDKKGETIEIEADRVLVAVGFRPVTDGLGLDKAGVELDDKGFIRTDEAMRTSNPAVRAIGDCTGGPLLAHKASKEGIVAAESIAGGKGVYDVRAMPSAIFTDPEIATVGLTEDEAREQGFEVEVGRFPMTALGRALTVGNAAGMVKVVADKDTGLVLGAGIVAKNASDMIAEPALAIEMGALVEDVALTVHAHPTFPEAFMEACEAVMGEAIHST